MSLIIQKEDIVDRVIEAGTIESVIREAARNREARAIVLWGDSGYGKSAIVQKVQANLAGEPLQIAIVETPPTNNATPIEGQYLNFIAETLDQALAEQLSLRKFLRSIHNEIKPLLDAETITHNGLSLKAGVFLKLAESAAADLTEQRLLYDTTTDSILLIKNYIETAIQTTHIILDITNAQNMDTTSFRVLNQILGQQQDLTMIFEYTTQGGRSTDLTRFISQLHCFCTEVAVDVLPFDFALTIFGIPEDPNKILEIEQFYKEIVKGNLYRIVCAKNNHGQQLNSDPIEQQIKELDYTSKLLLSILCLMGGSSTEEDFQCVRNHIEESGFHLLAGWEEALTRLAKKEDGAWVLRHASIGDALQLTPDNAVAITAFKFLSEYYESRINSTEDQAIHAQVVPQLANLYSHFDPSRLAQIIQPFKAVIVGKFEKDMAIQLVTQAFESLGTPRETEFHFMLIALCYEAGFYDAAMELLNRLKPLDTECGQAFHCMLLNRTDLHQTAVDECKALVQTLKNPRYRLVAELTQMLSERSLGLISQCRKTSEKIEKTVEYQDLLEYGFFLRNKQIVLSYKESLPYIERSINFFKDKGQELYANHSRLTRLVQQARLGDPKTSEAELEEIKPHLLASSFEKHIVYLNQASLRLLQGIADEKTCLLLDKALLTVTTTFDRAVVLNNKLCALIIQGTPNPGELATILQNLIGVIEMEPDTNLKRKVYANLALYYKMAGDTPAYKRYVDKVQQIKKASSVNPIEDVLLFGAPAAEKFRYLASQPCCVFFITYWHFDIPILDI